MYGFYLHQHSLKVVEYFELDCSTLISMLFEQDEDKFVINSFYKFVLMSYK